MKLTRHKTEPATENWYTRWISGEWSRLAYTKLILRGRCKDEGDWVLTRWERYWYTFKALVCVLLDRPQYGGYKFITVTYFGGGRYTSYDCANAYWWEYIAVARHGWRWAHGSDTNC